ncbi:hypothetical protein GOBAR_AA11107 [Gossypium barbadense]|uniref:Uncharacterized protein n=1 Tax=Gossypium barbadense TaxID=3634 RepID=A0A2P5Y1R7_GOSBA|nr:hypothetical protein GOBAR_AA11107 [Gossypium barbadense]
MELLVSSEFARLEGRCCWCGSNCWLATSFLHSWQTARHVFEVAGSSCSTAVGGDGHWSAPESGWYNCVILTLLVSLWFSVRVFLSANSVNMATAKIGRTSSV